MKRALGRCIAGAIAVASAAALASDGRLEINQSCVAAGCFAGDAPGFPIETAAARSYVLTSSVVVPDANTSAITLGEHATLDLNGFSIEGVTSCTASPTVCTNTGTGIGVLGSSGAAIRNGSIRKMGSAGVLGVSLHVEQVLIEQNGGGGIDGGGGSTSTGWIVRGCRVQQNGMHGIYLGGIPGADGGLVEGNVVRRNGAVGIRGEDLTVIGNAVNGNGGLGLNLAIGDGDSGFANNVVNDNNGGNANPQTSGGVQMGSNVCGGDTTCP